jgi:hypothetical protein
MLQIINLDTKEGIEKYESLQSTLDISEPYFLKEYIETFSNGTKDLICFSFKSSIKEAFILMPGYLSPVIVGSEKTNYYHFITPYGYTGPSYSMNISDSDIKEFWTLVDSWYIDNYVVTEFVRFNLFGNHIHYSGEIVTTLLNVKGKIIDEELQWTSFNRKVRKNVNKAKREHLVSKVYFMNISVAQISEFYDIYIQTMKRTEANERFLYTFDELENFIHKNERYTSICTIYFENTPVASELILISDDTIFSFLGGTNNKYFDKRPNDFLKVEALNWARMQGKKYYVLGGGYGFEDGIFKYKKNFFPNDVVSYYTGRKVLDIKIYEELVVKASNLRLANGLDTIELDDNSFFPLYNKVN